MKAKRRLAAEVLMTPGNGGHGSAPASSGGSLHDYWFIRGFDVDLIREFSRIASYAQLPASACVAQQGEAMDDTLYIFKGGLKLYKSLTDGRIQIARFLLPGDVLHERRSDLAISAISDTALSRFPKAPLDRVLRRHPNLSDRFKLILHDDLHAAHEHMLLLGRKTPRERLASFLLSLSEHDPLTLCIATEFLIPMRREDIANFLGLTLETVSRTFGQLRKMGLIDLLKPDHVIILDRKRLKALALGEDLAAVATNSR